MFVLSSQTVYLHHIHMETNSRQHRCSPIYHLPPQSVVSPRTFFVPNQASLPSTTAFGNIHGRPHCRRHPVSRRCSIRCPPNPLPNRRHPRGQTQDNVALCRRQAAINRPPRHIRWLVSELRQGCLWCRRLLRHVRNNQKPGLPRVRDSLLR